MAEPKKESLFLSYVVPIIASVTSAVATAYIAMQISLAQLEASMAYVKIDVSELKELVKIVTKNQIDISNRAVWVESLERRIVFIETNLLDRPTPRELHKLEDKVLIIERKLK